MGEQFLPRGAGAVEKALASIWNSYGRYGHLASLLKSLDVVDTPDDWIPWLVWDRGLEEIVPFVDDMQAALAEGPQWQRQRGTQAGIELGLSWVDQGVKVDQPDQRHDWWQFQIEIPAATRELTYLKNLTAISGLSKAAEDEMFRIFTPQGDLRPIRRDYHSRDHGRRDGYSGVVLWPGGPLVSMVEYQLIEIDGPDTNGLASLVLVVGDVLVASPSPEVSLAVFLPVAEASQPITWPEAYGDDWERSYSAQSQILTII